MWFGAAVVIACLAFAIYSKVSEKRKANKAQKDFEVDQIRDNIKREYCKEHNIPLIEIPYWERDNMRDFLIDKWKELNLNIA